MPASVEDRKPYHHGALREGGLLEGALLLQEKGVEKFSLREVARRLGVTPTALYHHFPDKEDLLLELGRIGLNEFHQTLLDAASGSDDSGQTLVAMGLAYVRFFVDKPHYLDLLFRPATKYDESVRSIWSGTFQMMETALVRRGLDPAEAPYFGVWLWSGVHGLAGMLRDSIIGAPDSCPPDAPPVFRLSAPELIEKIVPLVARLVVQAVETFQHPKT